MTQKAMWTVTESPGDAAAAGLNMEGAEDSRVGVGMCHGHVRKPHKSQESQRRALPWRGWYGWGKGAGIQRGGVPPCLGASPVGAFGCSGKGEELGELAVGIIPGQGRAGSSQLPPSPLQCRGGGRGRGSIILFIKLEVWSR